jgi:hypothetical protein
LNQDAAILHSYARGDVSWGSHVNQVRLVKDHINTIGEHLDQLQAIRHAAAPWQRQAVDSVVPVAVNLAAHTEAAIWHLSDRGKPLWDPNYTDRLRQISDRSDRVQAVINLHLEMADAQDKLERLRDRATTLGS